MFEDVGFTKKENVAQNREKCGWFAKARGQDTSDRLVSPPLSIILKSLLYITISYVALFFSINWLIL